MNIRVFFISLIICIFSFLGIGYITSGMIPYQDAPVELIEKQTKFIETYSPFLYMFISTFIISFLICCLIFLRNIFKKH